MTRLRRQFSRAERAQFAAQDLFGDRRAIFVEHPLRRIDQPSAHNPANRRDRTGVNHADERAPLFVIEQARRSRRPAIDKPVRPLGVEPKRPSANGLEPDPSEPSRITPRAAIVNCNQRQTAPRTLPAFCESARARSIGPSKSLRNEVGAALSNSPRHLRIRSMPFWESGEESDFQRIGITGAATIAALIFFGN